MYDILYPDGSMRVKAADLWDVDPDLALPDGCVARENTDPPLYFIRRGTSWVTLDAAEGVRLFDDLARRNVTNQTPQ